ncbi:aquaporin-like protein [Hortaea werneckii]|nr:aquaporin-like protein [Hortaea werneckii]KAI6889450.1 aquaporin-like protein [Hortaea werneckii]KAI6999355.1 aquaporin-like protein [Hortaea werneckii]KAI7144777.1 aquaporin-like protein [Hortaea werneckii]KAI7180170.1 aquaporin-like protein [Hortaea werneckii]
MAPHDEKSHGFDKPFLGFLGNPRNTENQSAILKHFVAATGEFVGTFLFLFFAFLGHQMAVDTAPNTGPGNVLSNQTVIYIAMSYGLSLLVTAWTMYRISGGLFNPAVTFGMVITGTLPPMRGLVLFPTQIISGMCAAGVAAAIVPGDIQTVQTTLAPGVSVARGLFLEMFLTAELVFTVLMLAAEKSKDTFIAPIGIGLALFVAEIAGVYYTGGSLNPARSFGPCIAGANFQSYHYIYWIGPLLGALIAGGYYHFVKFFNYEEANPGQDSAGPDGFEANVVSSMDEGQSGPQVHKDGADTIRSDSDGYHPGYADRQA